MRKTNLNDWKIIREEPAKPYLTHSIYESDNCDFAFYFSQIEEWGLMKYCTKLQIYKDKSAPQKIYDSKSVWFLFDTSDYIYDWTSEKLVCFVQLISKGNNKYSYPFIIINLDNLKYASLKDNFETLTKNTDNTITGMETIIDNNTKTEKKRIENIKLDELKWMPLNQLADN